MYENTIEQDIKNIQTIYISAHVNPDGDAVGSVMVSVIRLYPDNTVSFCPEPKGLIIVCI